ncbi:MAG: hypothetical protein EBY22_03600 [Gammaproteobacteria bacterium]|nr:hypothetical protein [Gammaproteobacteria bacterium]
MTTFKDLGFKIDTETMGFIVAPIQQLKTVKIENMADTLTDRDPPATFTPEEIEWMKSTPISQVTAGENYKANDSNFFDLLVNDKPAGLRISGRSPSNGEFRGNIVREVIETAKSTNNGSLTVYDAFQAHITNVTKSDTFIYVINGFIQTYLSKNFAFNSQSKIFECLKTQLRDRLNSFGESVFNSLDELNNLSLDELNNLSLDELNNLSLENQELTEKAHEFLQNKLQEALNEAPISSELVDFLNAFEGFNEQLEIVKEKSTSFEPKSKAYIAATELFSKLDEARNRLIEGNNSIEEFKTSCATACAEAESSALKEHRGWKQVFANIGFAVVSIATLGMANFISKLTTGSFDFSKTNTDSINKTLEMKKKLHDISPDNMEDMTAESDKSDKSDESESPLNSDL